MKRKPGRPDDSKKNGWKYLTEKQLDSFLTAVAKSKSLRDEVIFSLALYLGLRVQEIVNIELRDIDSDMAGVFIRGVKEGVKRPYTDLDPRLWKKLCRYTRTLDKQQKYLFYNIQIIWNLSKLKDNDYLN